MPEDDPGTGDGNPIAMTEGEDHKFTTAFTDALPGFLDKEALTHEDGSAIKMFETTPTLKSLVKMAFDTKTAMGKKTENVIQKPGEGANEDTIAAYMAELDAARGVPTEAQNYEFPLGDGETEEKLYSEEQINGYKAFAKEHNVPAPIFNAFVQLNRQFAATQAAAIAQKTQEAEGVAIEKIKKDNQGEKLQLAGKQVFATLTKLNKNNPEFLAKMKEAEVFENPTDFQRWKNAGVTPQNFDAWLSIAQELKISHSSDGEGGGGGSGVTAEDILPKSAQSFKKKG